MRKITMKRKSKTLNSDVPEEDKSDEGADSSQEDESPSKKSKRGKRTSKSNEENGTDKKKKNDVSDEDEEEEAEEEPKKGKKSKRTSKANEENGTDKKAKNNDANDEEEEEYEVEKVVGDKMVRGTRHFLIRWKGHDENADTWEPENTLNCDELINEYLSTKGAKSQKSPKRGKATKESLKKKSQNNDDEESSEEIYEVDKIIDVYFKKNGQREFLVHWKGYSGNENTWEPEDNMNCPDLIEKFMAKVEKAKALETKELRVRRKPTDRFTVLMEQSGRKLSRRNLGKQRVHYFDAE